MKFFHKGYWQKIVTILLVLLEFIAAIGFIVVVVLGLLNSAYALVTFIVLYVLSFLILLFINYSSSISEYRISWMFLVGGLPLIGPLFYLLFAHKVRTGSQTRFLEKYFAILKENDLDEKARTSLEEYSKSAKCVSDYILRTSNGGPYQNSSVQYFPLGDEAWPLMLQELEKAKHYIYIEFFIIKPGKMWDSILAILERKAKEGVDVRLIYDDFGNLGSLPTHYDRKLNKKGIKARIFMPIRPLIDVRMNNRDHRKIMVIDGHTCFTGGINLADEYVNVIERFGHWKDNAILVIGEAVYSYTLLFLSNWITSFEPRAKIDFSYYHPNTFIDEIGGFPEGDGFVQPYGDLPYADYAVGIGTYQAILSKSRHYTYISTPYLILDEKMKESLISAALQGVDVRIITPHIPDKKAVFALTRYNYGMLLKNGVKIYEYTPGFIHQKMFVSDDKMATVGTINLDYRSLYLHMENGTFIVGGQAIKLMKQDFLNTLEVSEEITYDKWLKWQKRQWLKWFFLRLFAPLL